MNPRAARIVLVTALRRELATPGSLAVTFFFYVIVVSVLSGLWRVAAATNGGVLAGYTAVQLTWYIAATEASTVALNIRMIDDLGSDIGSGRVASELLRPASVLGVRVLGEVGRSLAKLLFLVPAGILLCLVQAGPATDLGALGLAAPALLLAVVVNTVAQHAFAGAAFWLRNAGATWFLYQKLVFLLGGMLIPLEALPSWFERTAKLLPFMAMSYAPGRLAAGHPEPHLIGVQLLWLGALGLAAVAVFRSGERRLQVVGG